jgi:hypothetical protein
MAKYFRRLSQVQRAAQESWNDLPMTVERPKPKPRHNGRPRRPNEGYERGVESEERFLRVCGEFQAQGRFPSWFLGIEYGTVEDDKNGVDMVVKTERGQIPLQVKSSLAGRAKFLAQAHRRHIICIVVMPQYSDDDLFETAFREISFVWEMTCLAQAATE